MNCKFCQRDLTQVGCCGKTGQPILLCTGCGSLKLCDQEQLPSPLWFEVKKLRDEIATDDALLADRQRILDACQCPAHGDCVPHVLRSLALLGEAAEAMTFVRDCARDSRTGRKLTGEGYAMIDAVLAKIGGPK